MKYYVYKHSKASNWEVFYIGKGHGKRAWRKVDRSDWWHKTVSKHGLKVEIIQDNLSETEAFNLEIMLIKQYGRRDKGEGGLINQTDGGEGVSNPSEEIRKAQANGQVDKTIHKFHHIDHGYFTGTRNDLVVRYGLSRTDRRNISDMVRLGRYSHVKGWTFEGNTYTPGIRYKPKRTDLEVYTLFNEKEGCIFVGGRHEFCDMVKSASPNFSLLKSGVSKTVKGFRLVQ